MNLIISNFASHLKNEVGRTPETIVKYTGNLKILFTRMRIYDVAQLHEGLINRRLLDDFWSEVQTPGKMLSDQTRANYLSALKAFLKFCHKYGHLKEDISDKIVIPKKRLVYLEGLSKIEQAKLRSHIARNIVQDKDIRDSALIMFLWGTGCRISEALRLNCHPDGYIYTHDESVISGDFFMSDGKMYVHFMGKRQRDRRVIVSRDILMYLNYYLTERKYKGQVLFQNMVNNRSKETRLSRNGAQYIVNQMFKKLEIRKEQGLSTHTLRHTAINTWLENNYSFERVAAMVGNTPETIYKYYFNRNKSFTDVFGEDTLSTGILKDKDLAKFEDILRQRHGGVRR